MGRIKKVKSLLPGIEWHIENIMVLNSEISNYFGAILTGVFAMSAEGKEYSPFYAKMENAYLDIIAEIKGRKPCDMAFYRNMLFKYDLTNFRMLADTYQLDDMVEIINTNATSEELKYCKDTLKQFVLDAAINFGRPDISRGFSLLIDSFK